MRSLLTILKNILQRLDDVDDYIFEQGTSGMWTYRKWNSGIAECWGETTVTTAISTNWGNAYISSYLSSPDYPTGLFTTVNCAICTLAGSTTDGAWIMPQKSQVPTTRQGDYYLVRGATLTSQRTFTICYHTRGKWK